MDIGCYNIKKIISHYLNSEKRLMGDLMEYIRFFDNMPDNFTYPEIQPKLIEKVRSISK